MTIEVRHLNVRDSARFHELPTRHRFPLLALGLALTIAGCPFTEVADAKFGDQHFKTAIALIELYKVRHGQYPESMGEIDFVGDWDAMPISSVDYKKVSDGYELNLVRGWMGKPNLTYPAGFWTGLGLKKSNMKGP